MQTVVSQIQAVPPAPIDPHTSPQVVTPIPSLAFRFSDALTALRDGQRVARAGWNGKGMWIALQVPDTHSKMTLPYIYMKTVDDQLVPWLASQTDILAEDWTVIG